MEYKTIEELVAALKDGKIDPEDFRKRLDELLGEVAEEARQSVAEESVAEQRIRAAAEKARRL